MLAQRWLRALVPLLIMLLLSACLVRMAYNNADWLLIWQLDDYFDLTPLQKEFLKEHLREHLRWHRKTELEKTIAFLRRTQTVPAGNVTKAELETAEAELAALRNTLANRLAEDSAEFFAQVSDEQLDYLQKSLQRANKDWEKRAKRPPRQRSIERTERVLDIVTDWIGPLSNAQEKQLTLSIEHLPDVLDIWLAYTRQRQQQFVELVRTARTDRAAARDAFVTWISDDDAPPELRTHRAAVHELILEIDRLATPKQHEHFNRKLQNWIDDLQLAKDQGSA